ncbi:hypothetical protein B0H14DRAFT_2634352 [Mycena olivaceomarginata]|nr:hypothetical protein B0H14DRAFT_2634352 [Mycena olivaceomarginata]
MDYAHKAASWHGQCAASWEGPTHPHPDTAGVPRQFQQLHPCLYDHQYSAQGIGVEGAKQLGQLFKPKRGAGREGESAALLLEFDGPNMCVGEPSRDSTVLRVLTSCEPGGEVPVCAPYCCVKSADVPMQRAALSGVVVLEVGARREMCWETWWIQSVSDGTHRRHRIGVSRRVHAGRAMRHLCSRAKYTLDGHWSRQEDHGNAEQMQNVEMGVLHTAYTCNSVPALFILTGDKGEGQAKLWTRNTSKSVHATQGSLDTVDSLDKRRMQQRQQKTYIEMGGVVPVLGA